MPFDMMVMVKQVPNTLDITEEAMKPDGTVNREALPAIFNPEDLNALEEAIKIKERYGGNITVITMGPPKAVEVLKESLYRGADDVILLSDRIFAGSDTLATSYILKCVVEKVGRYDLVFCGRQAIDGDTAQVGPQLAEKLDINQLTEVSEVIELTEQYITVRRSIENGYEELRSRLPVLLTISSEANEPRFPNAKRLMTYKNILCLEQEPYESSYLSSQKIQASFYIKKWNAESIQADLEKCGLSGSATKVKKIENIVLAARETKQIDNSEEGIKGLIKELVDEHIVG